MLFYLHSYYISKKKNVLIVKNAKQNNNIISYKPLYESFN